MTARIVYVNSRKVPVVPADHAHAQSGDTLSTVREVYARHNASGQYDADLNGTLWERVAEAAEEPERCAWLIYAGTYIDQPEYCDDDALPDSEYCALHTARDDS